MSDLAPGTRIGDFEVGELLGAGGMGQVYRARDTKLDRNVALKVLPEAFTADPDRLARFEREAKVLASLNHPNIGGIHGLEESEPSTRSADSGSTPSDVEGSTGSGQGVRALVLELVEGATLAELLEHRSGRSSDRPIRGAEAPRLQGGERPTGLPVDEALGIATQIAEALEAAHEQGVIHRDLKPANVKVRPDGTVKVLDFGLAKAFAPDPVSAAASASLSPTISLTAAATQMGMVIGTAAYMAPEQAKGRPVDKRADVWAFGAVLYEMLTGRRPFAGDDVSDTLALVLKFEPDWDALPADLPARIGQLLQACLQKDPKQRVHDIADVRLAMAGTFDTPAPRQTEATTAPLRLWQQPMPALVAVLLVAVIAGVAGWRLTGPAPAPPPPMTRFTLTPPGGPNPNVGPMLVEISPDGRTLVYAGADQLYRRDMAQLEWQPIPGTELAFDPAFSPDGAWLAFENREGLKRVRVSGGPVATIVDGVIRGMDWVGNDTVIYGLVSGGLFRVPAAGGVSEPLTAVNEGEILHMSPHVLPGGEAALFTVRDPSSVDHVAIVSLEDGEYRTLSLEGGRPRYLSTGHIIFSRDSALWAARFDVDGLELVGSPVPVLEDLQVPPNSGFAQAAVANDGTLMYLTGSAREPGMRSLVWVDRGGREEALPADRRYYNDPRISPDGTRVVVTIDEQEEGDLWTWDLAQETLTRLTFEPRYDHRPTWMPDSQRVLFASQRTNPAQVFSRTADGSGGAEQVTGHTRRVRPSAVSADGRHLVVMVDSNVGADLARIALEEDGTIEMLLDSRADERNAVLSPDGRWLAYQSDESGTEEIYVRPFPDVQSGWWQVSRAGGIQPTWSPNGEELYYVTPEASALMAVPVDGDGATFTRGNPVALFDAQEYAVYDWDRRDYDVAPEGGRFLMLKFLDADDAAGTLPEIVIVEHWFEELERLTPVN